MDFSASYAHGADVRSTGGCEGTLGADGPPAGAISAESATSVNPVTPTKKISIDAESAEWIQKMELELEGLRIKPMVRGAFFCSSWEEQGATFRRR